MHGPRAKGAFIEASPTNHPAGVALENFLSVHGSDLIGIARRYSASATDAEDALQSALEILITKPPAADLDGVLPWLNTVVRNEALMIRRRQRKVVDGAFDQIAETLVADGASPEERLVFAEEHAVAREALSRLSPDQARCLLLRADGLRYAEIEKVTGFSEAKVKRSLAEGRRVWFGFKSRIDSGAECRRLNPMLSRAADGELLPEESHDLEPHLENCSYCRATVRDYAEAPREIGVFFPVGFAAASNDGLMRQLFSALDPALAWLNQRVVIPLTGGSAQEIALVKKVAIVTAASVSLVGGGATLQHVSQGRHGIKWQAAPSASKAAEAAAPETSKPPLESSPTAKRSSSDPRLPSEGEILDPAAPQFADGEASPQQPGTPTEQDFFPADQPVTAQPDDLAPPDSAQVEGGP